MKFLAFYFAISLSPAVTAQDTSRIFIEAGKRFLDVVTPSVMFKYKEFKPGRILFKDGSINDARLNYNLFNGEIVFISPQGDTLAIAKEQMFNIKRLSIDTSVYVFSKGYLEIVRENPTGILARRRQYYVFSREKIGGYNSPAPTSAIDSYSSFFDRQNNPHNLVIRENLTLQLKTEYYIGDPYNHFLLANRKNIEKIFFKKRKELAIYLGEHNVNFNNEQDVTRLFTSLTSDP